MSGHIATQEAEPGGEPGRKRSDALPCLLLVCQGGLLVAANATAAGLLDVAQANLCGTPLLDWVAPESRQQARQGLEQAEREQPGGPVELRMLRRDGRAMRIEANFIPARHQNQPAAILLGREVSEPPRSEPECAEREQQLLQLQRLQGLGVLVGSVAHDVNNVLSAVIGNLDLALLKVPAGTALHSHLEVAVQAGARAAGLMRQLLAYAGKRDFRLREVQLSRLVQENAQLLRACATKNVAWEFRLARELSPILADPGQIQQVVMNLLTNAAEAIGDQAGTITLGTGEVRASDEELARSCWAAAPAAGRFAFVEVADTGSGMDAPTRQHLFEPFLSTKATGRGLGMAAVQSIVRAHHGALFLDSEPGRGTTVRALFPIAASAEPTAETRTLTGAAAPTTPAALTGTVLIVDDEAMVRSSCAALVYSLGLTALVAADGEEAVALYRERADQIDCVLLDLTMPKKDGLATFRELRAINPTAKVVLVSGSGAADLERRFAGEGIFDFLEKPYTSEALARMLQRVLPPRG